MLDAQWIDFAETWVAARRDLAIAVIAADSVVLNKKGIHGPEREALEAARETANDRVSEIEETILGTPAQTMAGLAVKLAVVGHGDEFSWGELAQAMDDDDVESEPVMGVAINCLRLVREKEPAVAAKLVELLAKVV